MTYLLIYLGFLALMSIIAFFFYLSDKNKAKKKVWRTPEAVLLGLGFFGGAIGALISMNLFRHKTKHWYFWAVNILGLIVQIAAAVLIILCCL